MTDEAQESRDVTVPAPNSDAVIARITSLKGGLSDRKFARKIGLELATYQYMVKVGNPKLDQLVKISQACGVSIDWLATGEAPRAGVAEDQAPYGEPLDEDLMMECMLAADHFAPAGMDPAEKARRTLAVYREAKAKGLKISNIMEILKAS